MGFDTIFSHEVVSKPVLKSRCLLSVTVNPNYALEEPSISITFTPPPDPLTTQKAELWSFLQIQNYDLSVKNAF